MANRTAYAFATFTADSQADAVVYAFQAARLAVIESIARRLPEGTVAVSRPAPSMLCVTTDEPGWAVIAAGMEKAQAYGMLELDVFGREDGVDWTPDADAFARSVRNRTDFVPVLARLAPAQPAY